MRYEGLITNLKHQHGKETSRFNEQIVDKDRQLGYLL